MEGSRLQKLEKLRDLTQRYAEIAAELGIVEDPTARSLVMEVKKSEEQPLRVVEVPRPRLRPPLRSDATTKMISVAQVQRTPQRPTFKPVPYLSREESEVMTPIRRTVQKSVRGLGAHGVAVVVKSAWFTRTAHGVTPSNTGWKTSRSRTNDTERIKYESNDKGIFNSNATNVDDEGRGDQAKKPET
ncbi:hypothetical protein PV326_009582 [Microctonus aethiopoides]|nr:hypothetical protein PV326_009582 [Microctonus aethiopoides]